MERNSKKIFPTLNTLIEQALAHSALKVWRKLIVVFISILNCIVNGYLFTLLEIRLQFYTSGLSGSKLHRNKLPLIIIMDFHSSSIYSAVGVLRLTNLRSQIWATNHLLYNENIIKTAAEQKKSASAFSAVVVGSRLVSSSSSSDV